MKAPRSNRTGSGGALSLLKISFGKPVDEEATPYSTETTGAEHKMRYSAYGRWKRIKVGEEVQRALYNNMAPFKAMLAGNG